jgi:hypothetical protein
MRIEGSPGVTCEHGAAGARASAPHTHTLPSAARAERAPSTRDSEVPPNSNPGTPDHDTKIGEGSGAHLVPMPPVAATQVKMRADAAGIFPSSRHCARRLGSGPLWQVQNWGRHARNARSHGLRMHESMRDRLRRMTAGALPVERNTSGSLRTIFAGKITKCCVARQCAKLVTSESSRHAKEWELRRKLRAYIRSQQYA